MQAPSKSSRLGTYFDDDDVLQLDADPPKERLRDHGADGSADARSEGGAAASCDGDITSGLPSVCGKRRREECDGAKASDDIRPVSSEPCVKQVVYLHQPENGGPAPSGSVKDGTEPVVQPPRPASNH